VTDPRRFPPPWSVDEPDPKLDRHCYIVRDANGQALAYVYFEGEPGRRAASVSKLHAHDEARRIAANIEATGAAALLSDPGRFEGVSKVLV
jgi:hypothetical protein